MSVAFRQNIAGWSATTGVAGTTFTATAADTILVTGIADGGTCSFGGTVSSYALSYPQCNGLVTNQAGWTTNQYSLGGGNQAMAASKSAVGGSQHATISSSTGGDTCQGFAIEYSGVANMGSAMSSYGASPGAGAGAIKGLPVAVPTGGVLVACCVNTTGATGPTVAGGGTSRGSGSPGSFFYIWGEWAGAGAYITPQFTCTSGASDLFNVTQWVLVPSGVLCAIQAQASTGESASPLTINMINSVPAGDVVAVLIAGQGSTAPFTITDTVNGSTQYTKINAAQDVGSSFFGAVYFLKFGSTGTPTITVQATTDPGGSGEFAAAVHLAGWAGTPTVDTSASVTQGPTTSQSQQLAISTHFINEVVFIMPWSGSDIDGTIVNGDLLPTPTGLIFDTTFFHLAYNNPGAVNFSGHLAASSTWYTVGGGLYDNTTVVIPPVPPFGPMPKQIYILP